MKYFDRRLLRFILAGGFNTLATYVLYVALLPVSNYSFAFTLSFIAGILIAYLLNAHFVFSVVPTRQTLMRYPLVYLLQYGLGLGLLVIEVDGLSMNQKLSPLLNVVILIPVTFLLNKWFLTGSLK